MNRDVTITAYRDGGLFRYVVSSHGRFIRDGWTTAKNQAEAIQIARAEHFALEQREARL